MRIFAFGGTRYAERARVGQWPADFSVTAEFEDLYPLPFGRGLLSYGAGVRDGSPFLIVRQRQNEDDRGGYAYTVLLDPGPAVWEQFEFNAARLLLAAQQHDGFWTELLTSPNVLATPAIIAEKLKSLSTAPSLASGTLDATRVAKLKVALLGSLVSTGPIAVGSQDLGLDGRLSIGEAALALDQLPRAVRLGLGWLMGGRPGTGVKFGCRLILDDVSDEPLQGAESAMALGAEAASAVETVERHTLSDAFSALLAVPVHAWTEDPAHVIEQCQVLAALATEGITSVQARLRRVKPDDVLYDDVRREASSAIGAARVPVPAEVSEWALEASGSPELVPREIALRTDAATLARYLNASSATLASPSVKHFALPPDAALDVWCAHIVIAPAEMTPALVHEALKHLLTRTLSQSAVDERVTRVVQAALRRGAEAGLPLRGWLRFQTDPRVWKAIGSLVATEARQQVATGRESWPLDYVLCADDPGAQWLHAEHGVSFVEQAITSALAYLRDKEAGPPSRAWLDALAVSSVRRDLPLPVKLRIAEAAGGRWLALGQLCQLLRGDRFVSARRPDAAEAAALAEELRQLVGGDVHGIPPLGVSIDLERIAALVGGELPDDVAEAVSNNFALDGPALSWLRAQAHLPALEAAIRRDWRSVAPDVLDGARPPALLQIVGDIRAKKADEQLHDLTLFFERMPPNAVVAALDGSPEVVAWLGDLVGDPRLDVAASDKILAQMPGPVRTRVFGRLAMAHRTRFEDLVAKLLGSDRPAAIGRDLFDFIAGDPKLREHVARSLLGEPWSAAGPTIAARFCARRT